MDMDFATSCPLVRPYLPRIRLLFVGSRFRSTLPSDGPSRFRPCASLVLHLHQVAQGTFTPRLPDMPGTQEGAWRVTPFTSRSSSRRSYRYICRCLATTSTACRDHAPGLPPVSTRRSAAWRRLKAWTSWLWT